MKQSTEVLVKELIKRMGDDPRREGLRDTPTRVVKMYKELFRGYDVEQKPSVTVFDNFKDGVACDEMIIDTGYFFSHCEHHLCPFWGQFFFGYIPSKKVLGLSKVSRIVDFYSAKLQIQERLVKEIVDELEVALSTDEVKGKINGPKAIGLVLKARHLCKEMRGVKKFGGEMTTSDLRGQFRSEPETRAEFLKLCGV